MEPFFVSGTSLISQSIVNNAPARAGTLHLKVCTKPFSMICGYSKLFPGNYETGVGGYKHVYFNSTRQTLAIWIVTVFAILGIYEAVRRVVAFMYSGRKKGRLTLKFT